tara:strand:- start:106 stop:1044 length:939 start_codon:yes stop_codon:yes gene_type:complete
MRNLLGAREISRQDSLKVLDTALEFEEVAGRNMPKLPTLRGVTVATLFFEDSTRTRLSFEVAANRLSADVMTFQLQGSSASKGESLKDTAQTVEAMGASIIILRHSSSGAAVRLASSGWVQAGVINAGDGTHEHPTQALLDAATLRREFFSDPKGLGLEGIHVGIVGDIAHSRVARSNVFLLNLLGAKVSLVGPIEFAPQGLENWPVSMHHDFDEFLDEKPDALMMLRVQKERIRERFPLVWGDYVRDYSLTVQRAKRLPSHGIVMHPGPINRGVEIASEVADSDRSVVLKQVRNGVSVRMAVLYLMWGALS